MKNLQRIIKQIALENNLSYEVLSCDLIIKLTKDNKIRYINGYKFGLNSHSLGLILDDKYATYELLKFVNIIFYLDQIIIILMLKTIIVLNIVMTYF